jgi:ATP-dependent Clp protease protease subunit
MSNRESSGPGLVVPMVVESNGSWERAYDVYSLLLKNRIVFLNTPVTSESANLVVAQLLFLSREGSGQPIHLYISSGFAIYDTMQMIDSPVYTYAVGMTASMGTALLVAGAKGHRYALPHATIHMHPATSGARGYTPDVRVAFKEQERLQTQLFELVGKHSGHTWQEIEAEFPRDKYMQAEEAREFGLIDHVLGDASDLVRIGKSGEIQLNGYHDSPALPPSLS